MKQSIYLIIFLLISSCEIEKEIQYDIDYEGDKIVVNGTISNQEGVKVWVNKSLKPTQVNDSYLLSNVKVKLFENNHFLMDLGTEDNQEFETPIDFLPNINGKYHLEVEADGCPKAVSNQQIIFDSPSIDSIQVSHENNSLYIYFKNTSLDEAYLVKTIDEEDEYLFNLYDIYYPEQTGLQVIKYNFYGEVGSEITVRLYKLSPDFIEFAKSYRNYSSTFSDSFFEVIYKVYTNIQNGYGIFSSVSYNEVEITI